MEIIIYRNEQCLAWEKALFELKLALSNLNIKVRPKIEIVSSQKEAERLEFYGSPTIKVDGKDIDPNLTEVPHVISFDTCRIYSYQGQFYDYPPKEMVEDYLKISGK